MPLSLLVTHHLLIVVWFNIVAVLSMYPLLMREGLSLPTWALCGLFIVMALLITDKKIAKSNFAEIFIVSFIVIDLQQLVFTRAYTHCEVQ